MLFRETAILATSLLVGTAFCKTVTLSNVALPTDQNGDEIITGEASVMEHDGAYYLYFNNWGSCPGVNCCDASAGCATCCFDHPPHPYLPGCGDLTNGSDPYGLYHTFHAYKTTDFTTFENLGVALSLDARQPGIVFRPSVIYNPKTKLFVMWFEDRGSHLHGYAVATSPTPGGPFQTTYSNVDMPGHGKIGDFNLLVDDDGSAYHVRTGFDIVKLNDNFTGPDVLMSSFSLGGEGPIFFKRNGTYYVLSGSACCACIGTVGGDNGLHWCCGYQRLYYRERKGGSSIIVNMANDLKGPWTQQGDVGSNPTKFDPHSPNNYVTKAQASSVFPVTTTSGNTIFVWLGNQWNSGLALKPPGPRNHDLLYWTVLGFNTNGTVKQVVYSPSTSFDMA